jgi:AcrR family transcriptional regulator
MPRLAEQTRAERRNRILDAAKICFVRHGFHNASMQQICAEARMSAGNFYRYFPSKDALIEGLCERDMADVAAGFAQVRQTKDVLGALQALMTHHLCERPATDYAFWTETTAESTRNATVAGLCLRVHEFIRARLRETVAEGVAEGSLRADCDPERVAIFLTAMFDGLVVHIQRIPGYDPRPDIANTMRLLRADLLQAAARRPDPNRRRARKPPPRVGVSRR